MNTNHFIRVDIIPGIKQISVGDVIDVIAGSNLERKMKAQVIGTDSDASGQPYYICRPNKPSF
jgi:hypothetical protein